MVNSIQNYSSVNWVCYSHRNNIADTHGHSELFCTVTLPHRSTKMSVAVAHSLCATGLPRAKMVRSRTVITIEH